MNQMSFSSQSIERLEEAIAKETDSPIEVVRMIFQEEYSAVTANAKITQFAGVIAGRRARLRLKDR